MASKYTEYLTTALWGRQCLQVKSWAGNQILQYSSQPRAFQICNKQTNANIQLVIGLIGYHTWKVGLCHLHRNCAARFSEKIDLVSFMGNTSWQTSDELFPLLLYKCASIDFFFPIVSCQQYSFQSIKSILWNSNRTSCYWTVVSFLMPCWTSTAWGMCRVSLSNGNPVFSKAKWRQECLAQPVLLWEIGMESSNFLWTNYFVPNWIKIIFH